MGTGDEYGGRGCVWGGGACMGGGGAPRFRHYFEGKPEMFCQSFEVVRGECTKIL